MSHSLFTNVPAKLTITENGNPSVLASSFSSGRSINGSSNPGWKAKIERGVGVVGNMTAVDRTIVGTSPANCSAKGKNGATWTSTIEGLMLTDVPSVANTSMLSNLDQLARVKAYQQLTADFSGAQFLAEFREALSMIRSPAKALRSGIDRLSKTNRNHRRKAVNSSRPIDEFVKAAGGTWLEYSFGWRPLISDIQSGYKALQGLSKLSNDISFGATHRTVVNSPSAFKRQINSYAFNFNLFLASSTEASVTYGGAATISSSTSLPARQLGVLPSDWVPVLWEVCPWSFAIDYFSTVGDALSASMTASYTSFRYVYKTARAKTRYNLSSTANFVQGSNGIEVSNTPLSVQADVLSVQRSSSAGLPLPSLRVRSNMSSNKWLNLSALAGQMLADREFSYKRKH